MIFFINIKNLKQFNCIILNMIQCNQLTEEITYCGYSQVIIYIGFVQKENINREYSMLTLEELQESMGERI